MPMAGGSSLCVLTNCSTHVVVEENAIWNVGRWVGERMMVEPYTYLHSPCHLTITRQHSLQHCHITAIAAIAAAFLLLLLRLLLLQLHEVSLGQEPHTSTLMMVMMMMMTTAAAEMTAETLLLLVRGEGGGRRAAWHGPNMQAA